MDVRLLGLRNGTRFRFPESVFPEATLTLEVQATGVRVVMETEGGAMISISPAMLVMYEGRLQVVR
ncbi:hypothetical protein [Gordonia sp. (in: high G+C Gram-positive bacteria)]|uniref:hypothetical protein n=1 Tax=Gordonia sp. (in: high G+C Gram-positive bacteria) TaxID=84139 RepID=UPI001DF6DE4C|nr:hypothetical protein [Gordonia sp. (in: high G+C Gram-positive bacteria)]MCB1295826.1 hypothetical protein [Gordonia sp. (in: high G+C Gram-positive bacteria)]HMS75625.1 hypothetical protein [Gordonia sp. (in: high G+C Gram-positive bacteria)]